MELYVTVSFWVNVVALVLNLIGMAALDYPRHRKETLGFKVVQVFLGGAVLVWAGYLLYAN